MRHLRRVIRELSTYTLIVLALALPFSLGPLITSSGGKVQLRTSPATLQTSDDDLGYSGITPTSISLNWTLSPDPNFAQYVIQKSNETAIGPYETVVNIGDVATTSYFASGLTPGETEWWLVSYYNESIRYKISNVLEVTQPSLASLSYSMKGPTTVELAWNNNAKYGGLVSFDSYQLIESVDGGTPFPITAINRVETLNFTSEDLTPGTNYSLYLNTTDECSSCSPPLFSGSASNAIMVIVSGSLSVSASPPPQFVDVGTRVSFTCAASGGAPPYSYSWRFGDGWSGIGATPIYTYTTSGTMSAICTATDALGVTAESGITVSVSAKPFINSLTAQPSPVSAGQLVTITATVTGGSGEHAYTWTNLPPGCEGGNRASIVCVPSLSGTYPIKVGVTDAAGETGTKTMTLSVGPANTSPLPALRSLAIVLGALGTAAIITVTVAILLLRQKNLKPQRTR